MGGRGGAHSDAVATTQPNKFHNLTGMTTIIIQPKSLYFVKLHPKVISKKNIWWRF